jgi:Zn-dependent protease with chaperone function
MIWAHESPQELDKRISAELQAISPEAADLFRQAGAARESGNHRAAADLYARVQELAPGFDHAIRRGAYEESLTGNRAAAIDLGRKAVQMNASAINQATLALILFRPGPRGEATWEEKFEALGLVGRAVKLDPDDPFIQGAYCQAGLFEKDLKILRTCVPSLAKIAPQEASTHYFATILALWEHRLADARVTLEKSRKLGLPEETYRSLDKAIADSTPWTMTLLPIALETLIVWAAVFVALLGAGWLLSLAALRAASRVPLEASGRARGLDAALRRVYRTVLWLCSAFYYCSLPLLVLVVLAVGGGLIIGLLKVGSIMIKLVVIVAGVMLATLWSIVRSLFVRTRDQDPGPRLEPASAPGLRAVLDEVAGRVGTRTVDNVYLTPGAEVAVMERGGVLRQLAGARERCLILGVGALEGLQMRPFKAILAHEYGHFSNQDTAGGGFALAVRRSLTTMAAMLAASGAATWYNPAWLFLHGFHRVFLRISQGASRLQEVLADRWAAFLYGSQSFEEGLRHVISRAVRFQALATATLQEVSQTRAALANLYAFQPAKPVPELTILQAIQASLHAPPSPYDSHPSPADRFAWVRDLAARGAEPSADDAQPAWSMFADREAIERTLTGTVRHNVLQRYGLEIQA